MPLSFGAKVFGVYAVVAFASFMLFKPGAIKKPEQTIPGWRDLISCSDLTSLDQSKRLTLYPNNHATLDEGAALAGQKGSVEGRSIEGTWSFDETSKQYSVALAGTTTGYLLLSPTKGAACLLIVGKPEAANLIQSWFSAPPDDEDPGDQPGPYER